MFYLCIRYNREKPFKDFIDLVSYNRRLRDADVDKTVIAQTSKIFDNKAYGIQLIENQNSIKLFVNKLAATKKINSARFKSHDAIDRNIYEMKMSKKNNRS